MGQIRLKISGGEPDPDHQPPDSPGPLFRGTGDTDYVCGNCGFVIVAGFGPLQHVSVDRAVCPACSAENEFPADLRS